MSALSATVDAPYAYVVHTVNNWRLRGETVAYGASAAEVGAEFLAMGYVSVDVAPAAPVNGFAEGSVSYLPGDTFAHDTRTR